MDEDLRRLIDVRVRAGFDSVDEVMEQAVEWSSDSSLETETGAIERAVAAAIEAHRSESSLWPRPTDNDRLEQALEVLGHGRILGRQDFACCQSCGHAEIGDDVVDLNAYRGYVFFHAQDTERAVLTDRLFLSYGAFEPDADAGAVAEIGHAVANALRASGLTVDWDGDIDRRILLEPFTWRRRRP